MTVTFTQPASPFTTVITQAQTIYQTGPTITAQQTVPITVTQPGNVVTSYASASTVIFTAYATSFFTTFVTQAQTIYQSGPTVTAQQTLPASTIIQTIPASTVYVSGSVVTLPASTVTVSESPVVVISVQTVSGSVSLWKTSYTRLTS